MYNQYMEEKPEETENISEKDYHDIEVASEQEVASVKKKKEVIAVA